MNFKREFYTWILYVNFYTWIFIPEFYTWIFIPEFYTWIFKPEFYTWIFKPEFYWIAVSALNYSPLINTFAAGNRVWRCIPFISKCDCLSVLTVWLQSQWRSGFLLCWLSATVIYEILGKRRVAKLPISERLSQTFWIYHEEK